MRAWSTIEVSASEGAPAPTAGEASIASRSLANPDSRKMTASRADESTIMTGELAWTPPRSNAFLTVAEDLFPLRAVRRRSELIGRDPGPDFGLQEPV